MVVMIGAGTAAPEPIRIGWIGTLSGPAAFAGQCSRAGVLLAVDDINGAGGINGRPIEVIFEDDEYTPAKAVNAMQKLVYSNNVLAVLNQGPSSVQLATMPIAEKAGVTQFAVASSHKKVTGSGNKWVFRLNGTDNMFGGGVVDYMVNELGLKRLAILHLSDEFGYGARDEYEYHLNRFGLKPVAVEVMNTGDKDVRSQLMKIRRANADGIVCAISYHDGALVAKQARQIGFKPRIAGLAAWSNPKLIELGGEDSVGLLHGTPYFPMTDVPHMKEFIDRITAKGFPGDVYSAQGYDGMMLIAKAMKEKGISREGIRDGLAEVRDYLGVSSPVPFSVAPNGEFVRDVFVVEVTPELAYKVVHLSSIK
jgi:branched-chain amino acid transport system substrate-binding protein